MSINMNQEKQKEALVKIFCFSCQTYGMEEYQDSDVYYDICDNCFWQWDIIDQDEPSRPNGPNRISLNESVINSRYHNHFLNKSDFITMREKARKEDAYISLRNNEYFTYLNNNKSKTHIKFLGLTSIEETIKLSDLAQFNNISKLELSNVNIPVIKLSEFKYFPNLQHLIIKQSNIGEIIADVSNNTLVCLDIQGGTINETNFILECKQLKYLKLQENKITSLDFTNFNGNDKLEYLNFNDNQITTVEGLEELPELRSLIVSKNKLRELSVITNEKLESIDISLNKFQHTQDIKVRWENIKIFLTQQNQFTDMQFISLLRNVEVLNILYTFVNKQQIVDLQGLDKLIFIWYRVEWLKNAKEHTKYILYVNCEWPVLFVPFELEGSLWLP